MQYTVNSLIRKIYRDSKIFSEDDVIQMNKSLLRKLISDSNLRNENQYTGQFGLPDEALALILTDVCRVYRISPRDMQRVTKERKIFMPRHVFRFIAYELKISSLSRIGEFSGANDHTTVHHSHLTIKKRLEAQDPLYGGWWGWYLEEGNPEITKFFKKADETNEIIENQNVAICQ